MGVILPGRRGAPRRVVFIALALVAGTGVAGETADYHPRIDPANFQATVDNPYFPLVPGTQFRFIEKQGKHASQNVVTVTADTRVIMGVRCRVVRDQSFESGVLREDTRDWYAQDRQGNVWYFGEATNELAANGKPNTTGSWEAGVGRDLPGIIMPGHPAPGVPYRQEYGPGHAEDMGQVVAVDDSVTVPYGGFTGCVRTREWSRLEPGTEMKWYAKGIGVVRTESSDHEVATLVSVTRGK